MGNYLYKTIACRIDVRVLTIGLDDAGKTTILYKLKLGEVVTTIPTIGFNVETIKHSGVHITCWDVGCKGKMRPLIKHYYQNTDGLVFVIDSNDRERLNEAFDDFLGHVADEAELKYVPVLVLANKQDIKTAMKPQEIMKAIERTGYLSSRLWKVFGTSGLSGEGLNESLDWLTNAILDDKKQQLIGHLWSTTKQIKQENKDLEEGGDNSGHTSMSYLTGVMEYFKGFVVGK